MMMIIIIIMHGHLNYYVVQGPNVLAILCSPFLWLTMFTRCCIFHLDHHYHVFVCCASPSKKSNTINDNMYLYSFFCNMTISSEFNCTFNSPEIRHQIALLILVERKGWKREVMRILSHYSVPLSNHDLF